MNDHLLSDEDFEAAAKTSIRILPGEWRDIAQAERAARKAAEAKLVSMTNGYNALEANQAEFVGTITRLELENIDLKRQLEVMTEERDEALAGLGKVIMSLPLAHGYRLMGAVEGVKAYRRDAEKAETALADAEMRAANWNVTAEELRHELHDVVLPRLAELQEGMQSALAYARNMRDKHGKASGSAYEEGQWDMAMRLIPKLDALVSSPSQQADAINWRPVVTTASAEEYEQLIAEIQADLDRRKSGRGFGPGMSAENIRRAELVIHAFHLAANMSKYPEHQKLQDRGGANNIVGDFIEWLDDNRYTIARYDQYGPAGGLEWCGKTRDQLIADHFGIDTVRLENEKEAMIDEFRARVASRSLPEDKKE